MINTTPSNTVRGVTNYEYETIENEKKRSIDILRPNIYNNF